MKKRQLSPPPPKPLPVMKLEWSDGVTNWQDGVNAPTAEQLNPASEDGTYYNEIPRLSKKEMHWLERLGTAILDAKDPELKKEVGERIWLYELPAGYRLFEQIRPNGGKNGKGKRSDTYLYGHPKGPRKRYRSPQEFLPHLLWLASDVTKNPANCTCDKCKGGPPIDTAQELSAPTSIASPAPSRATSTAPTNIVATITTRRPSLTASRRVSQTQVIQPQNTQPQATQPQVQPPLKGPGFTPVPESVLLSSRTHRERDNDLTPLGTNVYRLGEQVWFQTGQHWALGVVLDTPNTSRGLKGYKIHPLHSPIICESTQPHAEVSALQLRPWVAWSTPPVGDSNLDRAGTDYLELPWDAERDSPSIEVDASILKSRDVDSSFTLVDKLTDQNYYAGVYLGAEKFWVGDSVRLKNTAHPAANTGQEILVVLSIQDLNRSPPSSKRSRDTMVYVTGDIYRLVPLKQPSPTPHLLPQAVAQDLEFRANITTSNPTTPYWNYVAIATGVCLKLESVKGRWYPNSSLYRIINGELKIRNGEPISQQEWDETGMKMNEMGSGGNSSTLGWKRYEERHHAFAKSIPSNIIFKSSLEDQPIQTSRPQYMNTGPSVPVEHDMQNLVLQKGQPRPSAPEPHNVVDLTTESGDHGTGMEFLEDDDFMRKMREEAASFLTDDVDDFYGGL